jgi:hypothetical protein
LAIENFGEEKINKDFFGDGYGHHEALDRTYIFSENLIRYILDHPSVALNEEAYNAVYIATQLLLYAYQALGRDIPLPNEPEQIKNVIELLNNLQKERQ